MDGRTACSFGCCACLPALALPAAAGAAEIVDRGVAAPTLVRQQPQRRARHVLGARRQAPRALLGRRRLGRRGSTATTRAGGRARSPTTSASATTAGPTRARRSPFQIAACDAPDGSHWALQQWSRLWRNYGGDRAPAELYISHWRGNVGELQIQTDYSYHGKHQHLWGTFTFHHKPVFGTKWTIKGVPTDKQGRNVYVDYLKGPVWRRVNSFLTHPPTAGFCYTFANHPASSPGLERPGHGRRLPRHRHRPGRLAGRAGAFRAARPVQHRRGRRGECGTARAARPRPSLPHRLETVRSGALAPQLHGRAVDPAAAPLDLAVGDLDDLHAAPAEPLHRPRLALAEDHAAGPHGQPVDRPALVLRDLDQLDPELAAGAR